MRNLKLIVRLEFGLEAILYIFREFLLEFFGFLNDFLTNRKGDSCVELAFRYLGNH